MAFRSTGEFFVFKGVDFALRNWNEFTSILGGLVVKAISIDASVDALFVNTFVVCTTTVWPLCYFIVRKLISENKSTIKKKSILLVAVLLTLFVSFQALSIVYKVEQEIAESQIFDEQTASVIDYGSEDETHIAAIASCLKVHANSVGCFGIKNNYHSLEPEDRRIAQTIQKDILNGRKAVIASNRYVEFESFTNENGVRITLVVAGKEYTYLVFKQTDLSGNVKSSKSESSPTNVVEYERNLERIRKAANTKDVTGVDTSDEEIQIIESKYKNGKSFEVNVGSVQLVYRAHNIKSYSFYYNEYFYILLVLTAATFLTTCFLSRRYRHGAIGLIVTLIAIELVVHIPGFENYLKKIGLGI